MSPTEEGQSLLPKQQRQKEISSGKYIKFLLLGLGAVTMILGFHSHLASSWVKNIQVISENTTLNMPLYKICQVFGKMLIDDQKKCPNIAFERFFVAITTICFILFLMSTVLTFCVKVDFGLDRWKYAYIGYHIFTATILLIAASLYITSATQIDDFMNFGRTKVNTEYFIIGDTFHTRRIKFNNSAKTLARSNFLYTEKLVTGYLDIVRTALHAIVAIHLPLAN